MALGIITNSGRTLTARLLLGDPIEGLTHCAVGDGDLDFIDPKHPPAPAINQIGLRHELARKRYYKRTFLKEDADGVLLVNGVRYLETTEQTQTIGVFFRFEEHEANGITIKEYGFFGGTVAYVAGHQNTYATDGTFHADSNPMGQVLDPGYLYELKHIPDFNKTADTRLELVGVIKV